MPKTFMRRWMGRSSRFGDGEALSAFAARATNRASARLGQAPDAVLRQQLVGVR